MVNTGGFKPGEFFVYGESSVDVHKTIIQSRPLLESPVRKIQHVNSSGRSGTFPIDTGHYENTEMELIMWSWAEEGEKHWEYRNRLFEIFNSGTYVPVEFYFDPGKIYMVMLSDSSVQFENKYYYEQGQTWKVVLTVYPWKYLESLNDKITLTQYGTINNPTKYDALPEIQVVGKGKINLSFNKEIFVMGSLPTYGIFVDSESKNSYGYPYEGQMENMNDRVFTKEYPVLKPGDNLVEWLTGSDGTVLRLVISPRWRTLM